MKKTPASDLSSLLLAILGRTSGADTGCADPKRWPESLPKDTSCTDKAAWRRAGRRTSSG